MKHFFLLINYSFQNYKMTVKSDYWLRYAFFFIVMFASGISYGTSVGEYSLTGGAVFIEGIAWFVSLIAIMTGTYFIQKDTILHTIPINYKRRTLYYYLSIAMYTVLAIVAFIVIVIVVILLLMLIFTCLGLNIFADDEEEVEEIVAVLSSQAYAYIAFKALFSVGAITAISRVERKRNYIICAIAYVLINIVGNSVLNALTGGNMYVNFNLLPNPTLAAVLCAIFAVAMCVASVAFVLSKEKPKKF